MYSKKIYNGGNIYKKQEERLKTYPIKKRRERRQKYNNNDMYNKKN